MPAKSLVVVVAALAALILGASQGHAGRLESDPRPARCVGEQTVIPTKVHNRSAQTAHLTLRIVRPHMTVHRFVSVPAGGSERLAVRARAGVTVKVKLARHGTPSAQNGGVRLERFDLIGDPC